MHCCEKGRRSHCESRLPYLSKNLLNKDEREKFVECLWFPIQLGREAQLPQVSGGHDLARLECRYQSRQHTSAEPNPHRRWSQSPPWLSAARQPPRGLWPHERFPTGRSELTEGASSWCDPQVFDGGGWAQGAIPVKHHDGSLRPGVWLDMLRLAVLDLWNLVDLVVLATSLMFSRSCSSGLMICFCAC